jgi:hypothetical protein
MVLLVLLLLACAETVVNYNTPDKVLAWSGSVNENEYVHFQTLPISPGDNIRLRVQLQNPLSKGSYSAITTTRCF